jgi:hypothetical protein
MISIETVAHALARAREHCLPGKETAAGNDVLRWCAHRLLYRRSSAMPSPKTALPHDFCQLEIEHRLLVELRKDAIARGTNAPALVRDPLYRIVTDRLCNAILDDQPAAD